MERVTVGSDVRIVVFIQKLRKKAWNGQRQKEWKELTVGSLRTQNGWGLVIFPIGSLGRLKEEERLD